MHHDQGRGILGHWEATGEELRDALEMAAHEALAEHKKAGESVVVWDRENDRIVTLSPEEIEVSKEPALQQNATKR